MKRPESLLKNQRGQMVILALVVVGIVLLNTLVVISGSQLFFQNTNYSLETIQALNLAEAGVDKAVASLNATGGSYIGETETALGPGTFSVKVTTPNSSTKFIEATGYIPSKAKAKASRTVKISVSKGVGASFNYGVQVGEGGLIMGNSNDIKGSIYSNGNISGGNSNEIDGDAWVAGGVQPTPDQQTDCADLSCSDFIFGTNVAGQNVLDVAQSFRLTTTSALNKVSLKIKKFGNPQDIILRILADQSGTPNKTQVLATGTLPASLVTSDYGWVDVAFSAIPNLAADTPYWIMLDTSFDSNNYWAWQNDTLQSYTRGNPAWSSNWNAGNPVWNSVNGDLSFKTYIGGSPTSIVGNIGFIVTGNVHANTISGLTIQKDAYYQSISSSTVNGHSYPGSPDPPPKVMPISDANITSWQNQAQQEGIISSAGISSCVSTLGPGKVIGDVSFGNCGIVTLKSPLWITGDLNLTNSNTLKLDSSYGASSGIIVVDGTTTMGNGNKLLGSGTNGSVFMLLSTYDSRTSGIPAISVNNSGNTGVMYAGKGEINVQNSNSFTELTAWRIRLINSVKIDYETGLAGLFFSAGPSGSFSIVPGTYQLK
ncbi:MAG: hypothetical protein M1142_00815 [Patescibacteria group bacterium]|nr:hypothetical protein [Patescibacteria group bacterium]